MAFCEAILRGAAKEWESQMSQVAFAAEDRAEEIEEGGTLDAVIGEEDLRPGLPDNEEAQEQDYKRLEDMDETEREADPEEEKMRKKEWQKLSREERVGIRRLHHMTSHSTRPQMQRMLKYAGALPHIVRGVKHFRCSACEKMMEAKKVPVVRVPNRYVFGEDVGIDVLELKDAAGSRWHIFHVVCMGTTYHTAECIGKASGVPSSMACLRSFNRQWHAWAGTPKTLTLDRGTHNRGIFQAECEKRGIRFKFAATESPHQLGRVERQGGVLKRMMERMIEAENLTGEAEIALGLSMTLETKNNMENVAGFTPAQWVLGRAPRIGDGLLPRDGDEAEDHIGGSLEEDPQSEFNKRARLRLLAREAWIHHDSKRRVRASMMRQGFTDSGIYKIGDLVSFMRKQKSHSTGIKWYGPARVLAQEGKNVWLLHGGIPLLIGNHMIRACNPEELLEAELLDRKKGNKRRRGVFYEDVRQPHQFDEQSQQQGFMDLREREQPDPSQQEVIALPSRGTLLRNRRKEILQRG